MKMLNEIMMKNIKGQDTVQRLTGKDIIIGPNGSGKTTRMQALGIALLGYTPGQGKKADETFKLANANTMSVGIKTDGFSFTREFKMKNSKHKDGSAHQTISQTLNISPSRGESKIAEKEARIISEFGNFPVMLDFNEFLSLSDSKRREFIYNLAGFKSSEWTKDRVKKFLEEKLLTMELEVNNQEQFEIMKTIIAQVLKEYPQNYDINAGLQSMIDFTKFKLSYWNDEKKRSESAVKKLAELKNKLTETDRNLKENKVKLEDLQEDLIKSEKQLSMDTQKKKNIDIRLQKIKQLEEEIDAETIKQNPYNLKELEEAIEKLKTGMQKVDYSEDIAKLDSKLKLLSQNIDKVWGDEEEIKANEFEVAIKIKTLKETLDKIKNTNCKCIIDNRIKCDKNFEKFIKFTESQIKKLQLQQNILASTHDELSKKEISLEKQNEAIKSNKEKLINSERSAYKVNNKINGEISKLNSDLNKCKNFKTLNFERIKSLREELEKYKNEPVEAIAPLDILEKKIKNIRAQIADLKLKIQEQEEAKVTLSNLKSSMIDGKQAEYYSISFKALYEALGSKGLQGELVKETLGPIQNSIQENLKTMGVKNKFYFSTKSETGKEIFQFGWFDEFGDKRNFDALSTGQQMILLIAMLTTFIEKASPICRILAIDNIENLDSNNLKNVLDGLNKLSDKLDNIILSGVIDISEAEGFTIWNLGKAGDEINEQSA